MARYALVDTLGLLYRAFFAVKAPMKDPQGRPVGAIYGFFLMLRRLLQEEKPDVVVFGLDLPGPTHRHQRFADYKAQRERMPEELQAQWTLLMDLLKQHGFNALGVEGHESDDVIATLATRLGGEGHTVEVFTGDKDLLQLVSENVSVVLTTRGVTDLGRVTPANVSDVFDVPAHRVVDKKALMGDSSDNIPGVRGIGEKTANDLVNRFGALEDIYAHLDEIKGATQKKLAEGREAAFFSRELVTLERNVPLPAAPLRAVEEGEHDALRAIYQALKFTSLLKQESPGLPLGEAPAPGQPPPSQDGGQPFAGRTTPLGAGSDLSGFLGQAQAQGLWCLDLETTGHDPLRDRIVGVALAVSAEEGFYLPVAHTQEAVDTDVAQWDMATLLAQLQPLLVNPAVTLLGHNLKFDLRFLLSAGAVVCCPVADSMVAAHLVEDEGGRIGLKAQTLSRLGVSQTTYEEATRGLPKGADFSHVPLSRATAYAAQDAALTLALYALLEPEMKRLGVWDIFSRLEMPLLPILARMEQTGIAVDKQALKTIGAALGSDTVQLELQFARQVMDRAPGVAVNMRSPVQLQKLFFDILGMTMKGKKSTDVEALTALRAAYPAHAVMLDTLLEHRHLSKLKSTYVDALDQLSDTPGHRVHTTFSQTAASTGRLSSLDPNLQNIPIRTARGRLIRQAFVPRPGFLLLKADYSQIELRVLAHVSGEPALLRAFEAGEDIHRQTAALLAGKEPQEVTKDERNAAKRVNFGVIYGMGPYALSQDLGVSVQQATQFIATYFERLPKVRAFIDETIATARREGCVRTLMGRRRALGEINSQNRPRREASERVAVNTVIQGTAAEWIKLAMIALDRWLTQSETQAALLLQVHDELVLEAPPDEMDALKEAVRTAMEGAWPARVPLVVDMATGPNWAMREDGG